MIKKLNKYIEDNGVKKSFVAAKLGITNVYLSYIINGKANPSIELEEKIRRLVA